MYYQSRGIILRQRDFKDSDKLLSIFTEKQGKITAIAKGVKKAKSSLRASVQPFCHSYLYFNQGKNMDLVTQAKLLDFYGNSRQDLERALHCYYLMELLDKSLQEHHPLPELYQVLITVMEALNEQGLNPLFIRYFESQLLVRLGYKPVLKHCVICGHKPAGQIRFSLADGGLLCPACQAAEEAAAMISLSGESLGLLGLLNEGSLQALNRVKASPASISQLEGFLEKYLEFHLDRRFKMKNTIRMLKKTIPFEN